MKRLFTALAACIALAACGGSGSGVDGGNTEPNDVEPMLIPGGGVSSGAVRGEINVHAIDDETGAAVANAMVRLGTAADPAPGLGSTDNNGLAVFIDPELIGPQTVTISATGYAAATWIGVNGANVDDSAGQNSARATTDGDGLRNVVAAHPRC